MFPRALDGEVFAQWVRDRLVPTLRPGQVVVQDNRSVHKDARARAAIAAAGCRLEFLPVSSPDDNPIELVVAKLTSELRTAKPRTREAVETASGASGAMLDRLTPGELTAYYRHCGYPVDGQSS